MGHFVRHGVSEVVIEIGLKHPRVVGITHCRDFALQRNWPAANPLRSNSTGIDGNSQR